MGVSNAMKIDVLDVAKLADLEISEKEVDKFEKQLSSILDYIENLKKLNTENIEETSQVTALENVTREDFSSPSLPQEEALLNADKKHNGFFEVEAILE